MLLIILSLLIGVEGVPDKRECLGDLFWNQDIKSCDLPENVDCKISALGGLKTQHPIRRKNLSLMVF